MDCAVGVDMAEQTRPGKGRRHAELLVTRDGLHRYALWLSSRGRDLLSRDEVVSAADLAMVRAWEKYEPEVGRCFAAYARPWVRGAILREL
ncbi:MAG: sigma factor, partial [Myxococcota bacterium]|nr:sigma factor [Myxococcota bacterium]